MAKIFISHSSQDNDFAAKLANTLREWGAEVWIDLADIPAGTKWSTAIQQALKQCEVMLLVITPDSMESTNVEDEWQYYIDKKKLIIPVRWIPADVHFQLNRYQYVDFHERDFDLALSKLGAELSRLGFALPKPTANSAVTRPAASAARTKDARQFPLIIKPDWVGKIIPEPFEWCFVPEGTVKLKPSGHHSDYLRQEKIILVPEYLVARYPITNAQFEAFLISEDGWQDTSWWNYCNEAKTWRQSVRKFGAPRFKNCGDCPRETVTWFTVVAFTRWLSAKTDERITLPKDTQWQRAAQSSDVRIYPWGNEWNTDKSNSSESGNDCTTPVTKYPLGLSPFGTMDMSGNVWELCLTGFETGSNELNEGADWRCAYGGSWNDTSESVRAASRTRFVPDRGYNNVGFRVISDFG